MDNTKNIASTKEYNPRDLRVLGFANFEFFLKWQEVRVIRNDPCFSSHQKQ